MKRQLVILGVIWLLAGIVVPVDDFSAEIVVRLDVFWLGFGGIMCSLRHFVWNFCEKFLIGVVEIFKRTFVGITCSLWHFDGSAEIFAIFDLCLITAQHGLEFSCEQT